MGWIRRLFRTSTGKKKLDQEIDKEIGFHIEELTQENIASGMSPEKARREALIAFGGPLQLAEDCRRERSVSWLDDFIYDLRFAWRMLLKSPGYTITAVLALSLGIGPNTAFFTIYNAILLKPLPIPLSERVVSLDGLPSSYSDYEYYRDHNTMLDAISAYVPSHLRMTTEPVLGLFVSSSYFSVMGADPVAGSSFTSADDRQAAPPYPAMLSGNFWERRFARDPAIVGKQLTFSGIPTVIVGITPRDFMGARAEVPDVWLPLIARGPRPCCILEGRLKPGFNTQQAQAELTQLANSVEADPSNPAPKGAITVTRARAGLVPAKFSAGPRLVVFTLFQVVTGMVLLIACANVAGLLLGKAVARQKEVAVRLSLGASRGRLIRQLLTEAFVIAQLAGVLSLLLTWGILRVLVRVIQSAVYDAGLSAGGTVLVNVTPDFRVLFYALGISTLTAVAFALLPALQTTRVNLTESLNDDVSTLGGNRKSRLRDWTVSAQIAVCLMLLIAAGTLVFSSSRLLTTDPGFHPDHVLTISLLDPRQLGYSPSRVETTAREMQERLSAVPGVASLATASRIPLGGLVSKTTVVRGGAADIVSRSERYPLTFVSSGYFETLGITLLQGRPFTPQEISNRLPVVVISNALAKTLWPGEDPLGKMITTGSTPSLVEVVGVVQDVYSDSMMHPDPGALYLPSQQAGWESNVFIRTEKDPSVLTGLLSAELQSVDSNLAPSFQTLNSVVNHDIAFIVMRAAGIAFSTIGGLGLVLALVGIYSMVGYTVGRQTREIGIRMALGAQTGDVRRLILLRSMPPIGAGLAAGMLLGITVSLLMSRLIQGIRFLNPEGLAAISILIMLVAALAAYLPARRATNLDPSIALRSQ